MLLQKMIPMGKLYCTWCVHTHRRSVPHFFTCEMQGKYTSFSGPKCTLQKWDGCSIASYHHPGENLQHVPRP